MPMPPVYSKHLILLPQMVETVPGTLILLIGSLFICLSTLLILLRSEPVRVKDSSRDTPAELIMVATILISGTFFSLCVANLKMLLHK